MQAPAIGIDFGTSNTAAAILRDGAVRLVPLEGGQDTLPTAIFGPRSVTAFLPSMKTGAEIGRAHV